MTDWLSVSSVPICLFISYLASFLKLRETLHHWSHKERTKAKQISRGLNNSLGGERRIAKFQSRAARNRALLWIIGSLKKTRDIRLVGKKCVCHAGSEWFILSLLGPNLLNNHGLVSVLTDLPKQFFHSSVISNRPSWGRLSSVVSSKYFEMFSTSGHWS